MATTLASFEAGHQDMVHDVQLDYYGRRLATASSDRTVKVFDVVGEQVGPAPARHAPVAHWRMQAAAASLTLSISC